MRAVYVVGDVMLDVVVEVTGPFSHASDTPSVISTSPGGAAANQSVALARAGAPVTLVGAVGADPFGDAAGAALRAAGVNVALLARTERPTGVVVALVEPDGQRSMLTDRGANLALDIAMIDALDSLVGPDAHVHVSGYCLLDEATRAAGLRVLALARDHGASISVDASSAGPLRALGADRFISWVRGVDYLFCNREEGEVLTSRADTPGIAERLATIALEAIVTEGPDGALVATRDGQVHRAPAEVARVEDTIGAGDSFTATYLVRRLQGADVVAALADAATSASRTVARRGARDWASRYSRE
jgi:sugar/nucleoside kinase (ribokinase family)